MRLLDRRARHDERGIALITVLLVGAIIVALVATTLSYATGSQGVSRYDQDWNAALPAAEAGIDDYLSRLNADGTYTRFSTGSPDPSNAAFSGYVPVPGPSGSGQFRYAVDTSRLALEGIITVTSTGRVRNADRVIRASLRRRTFLDYLYVTEYETTDPDAYSDQELEAMGVSEAWVLANCGRHWYDGRSTRCRDIQFADGDVIQGPLHSDDALLMNPGPNGPRFQDHVSTNWPDPARRYWRRAGTSTTYNPRFRYPGEPAYVSPLTMPPSNTGLLDEARRTGCLFTGPTKIVLRTDGKMEVTSPYTKDTNPGTGTTYRCFTGPMGTATQVVNVPPSGVIYVQAVPSASSDPNFTSACIQRNGRNHPLGFPIGTDVTPYACKVGDAFVEGTFNGQATISAANDIIVTWDLTYQDGGAGDDLLGLIANNYVKVYHPVNSSGTNQEVRPTATTRKFFTNPVIHAAILTLNHSFVLQNHSRGADLGTMTVLGSIAQLYRGPVGTSGGSSRTGVLKDYRYDQRLAYLSPPRFIDPVQSYWRVKTWEER